MNGKGGLLVPFSIIIIFLVILTIIFLLKNIYLISFFLFPLLIIVVFSKFKYVMYKNCPPQSLGTSRLAAEETEENQRVDQLL